MASEPTATSAIDPARIPPRFGPDVDHGAPVELPDCVGVVDSFGVPRGCIAKEDYLPPHRADGTALAQPPGTRIPVYDHLGGEVVGYMVIGPGGFVDKAVGDDPAQVSRLVECWNELQTRISDACHSFLVDVGYLQR